MSPTNSHTQAVDDADIITGARACLGSEHAILSDGEVICRIARASRGLSDDEVEGFLHTLGLIGQQVGHTLAPVFQAATRPTASIPAAQPGPRPAPTAAATLCQLLSHPQVLQAVGAAALCPGRPRLLPAGASQTPVPLIAFLYTLAQLALDAAAELEPDLDRAAVSARFAPQGEALIAILEELPDFRPADPWTAPRPARRAGDTQGPRP